MKLDDVKPLDIDPYLGKTKNKVTYVGVELEGGWAKLPKGITALEHDGSVFNRRVPDGANFTGEFPIPHTTPAGISECIRQYHPSHVDHTCGMHVHMSFDNLWHYKLLMIPEYPSTMVHYLKQWAKETGFKDGHHIWERLGGKSTYCKNEFYPDLQAKSKSKTHTMNVPGQRYTGIHYCGRLKTIECRILPMMKKVPVAIAGVQEVIKITNACLYLLGKQNAHMKVGGKVELADSTQYEETIQSIL